MSAVKGYVSGRVQGVGFRYFVQRHAERLGVTGWAANLKDGRVEVLLCGNAAAIEELQQQVAQGPPASSVVDLQWQSVDDVVLVDFAVR